MTGVDEVKPRWSPARRVGFRFLFAYLVLHIQPFPLYGVPGAQDLLQPYNALWQRAALWVGHGLLSITREIPTTLTGSGDRTIDWLQQLTVLLLAIGITGIWSAVDRKRAHYRELHAGLRIFVRYYLAATMLMYAVVKLVHTQFPFPLAKLIQPFGYSSPMGLLWTFMGYSTAYNVFTGAVELAGVVLLLWRRTTTLGALLTAAALANVVALNFTYDVPVKLHSSHLLLIALWLAAPDARRLWDVLVMNRATAPVELDTLSIPRRLQRLRPYAKGVVIVAMFLQVGISEWGYMQGLRSASALDGLYEVEELTRDGRLVPADLNESSRWRRVAIEANDVRIALINDTAIRYRAKHLENGMELSNRLDPSRDKSVFAVVQNGEHLVLDGTHDGVVLRARLRRLDARAMPLLRRGFHWINEVPMNW